MTGRIKVAHLFSKISPTSAPYTEFTKGFQSIDSVPVPYVENDENLKKGMAEYKRYIGRCMDVLEKPDAVSVLHCHNAYLLPAAIISKYIKKRDSGVVFTLHTSFNLLKIRNKLILILLFLLTDRFVACGEAVRMTLPKFISNSRKTHTIRNGVNLQVLKERLKIDDHDHASAKNNYPSFYTASRLVSGKKINELIKVFKAINRKIPTANLHIYGDGPLMQDVIEWVGGDKNITLHGQVDRNDLYSYIPQHDVYISLSAGEGFPVAPIEALASGLLEVLSDIPPHVELEGLFPNKVFILKSDFSNLSCVAEEILSTSRSKIEITEKANSVLSLEKTEDKYLKIYSCYDI